MEYLIYTGINGTLEKRESYIDAFRLSFRDVPVLAFTGAGGKTDSIENLSREYAKSGKKIVVTTTTHIWKPEDGVFEEDIQKVKEYLKMHNSVIVGNQESGGKISRSVCTDRREKQKLSGISEAFLQKLLACCDGIFVEADGSKGLPVKVPSESEPVIPKQTTHTIGVIGISCIGKPIEVTAHRPALVAELLHKSVSDCITERDAAAILASTHGTKKQARGRYLVLMNQVNTGQQLEQAKQIISYLPDQEYIITGRIENIR